MGNIRLKKQSAASTPVPATDQLSLFVDSADDILKTKDSFGIVRPSGVGTADELATTGAPVDVSNSAPPTIGQVLVATSPISAVWSSAAANALVTSGADVQVGTSAPPAVGYLLVASSPTLASWQQQPAATRLATTGAPVVISAAAPPAVGTALVATSATTAAWATTGTLTPTAVQTGGATYSAVIGDLVPCDVTTGDIDVDLPAGHTAGQQIGVKIVSTTAGNVVTIFTDGPALIDGDTSLELSTDYEWAILMSDGTDWMQIG